MALSIYNIAQNCSLSSTYLIFSDKKNPVDEFPPKANFQEDGKQSLAHNLFYSWKIIWVKLIAIKYCALSVLINIRWNVHIHLCG
jgi:hypothetical protein